MPHPFGQRAVAHCLFDDARQSIARTDLMLFQSGEHERSAHARFHRMEIAELAATDLIHPYPFPGGAEIHDLLGDVPQVAQFFARLLETLCGAGREVARGLVRLGTLSWAQIEMRRPVLRRWFDHRA